MNKKSVNWTNKSRNCNTITKLLDGCLKDKRHAACRVYYSMMEACHPQKKIRKISGSSVLFKDFGGSQLDIDNISKDAEGKVKSSKKTKT